jgi:basic membrane protein A
MTTDVGGINDHAFNQDAYNGLSNLKTELPDIGFTYIESSQTHDYNGNIDKATDQNPSIVAAIGYNLENATKEISAQNPNQQYIIIDVKYNPELQNVISVTFRDHEAAFLIGYLSVLLGNTKVGFIGGMECSVIERFEAGFKAGIAYANKQTSRSASVVTHYAGSFTDPAKGKDIATKMQASGCEIIYSAAGGTGQGAIEAAKELDFFVLGVDQDQSYLAPKKIIASSLKNVGDTTKKIAKEIYLHPTAGIQGGNRDLGLEEGAVGIAFGQTDLITEEVKEKIEGIKKQICDHTIVVPASIPELEEFEKSLST